MTSGYVYLALGLFVLISGGIAYLARSGAGGGIEGYFLWNRSMGGVIAALSYSATTYSAFMLVGLAGLTYAGGVGALGFELIYFSGLLLIVVFGPRFLLVGKRYGYVTPSEMLGDRYGSRAVAVATALVSCIFLIPYSAVQLAGIGYLLDGATSGAIPFAAGTLIATVLAVGFALVAGIRSVAWTDALQVVLMLVTATVPDLANPDLASPALISSGLIPPVIGLLLIVGILAAAISTIDSILLTLSSMVARDVYPVIRSARNDEEPNEQRQLLVGKLVIPVIAVLALLFAGLQLDLIAVLSVASSAGLVVTVPAIVGAFFWRRGTAAGVLASVIGAGALVLILEATQLRPLGQASGVWGLAISTALYLCVSLATRAPVERAEEFMGFLKEALRRRNVS